MVAKLRGRSPGLRGTALTACRCASGARFGFFRQPQPRTGCVHTSLHHDVWVARFLPHHGKIGPDRRLVCQMFGRIVGQARLAAPGRKIFAVELVHSEHNMCPPLRLQARESLLECLTHNRRPNLLSSMLTIN